MDILLLLLFVVICFVLAVSYAQRSVPLDRGARAPQFVLADQFGKEVSLPAAGQPVVLAFFPRDNTSRCLAQLREFSTCHDEFGQLGYKVFFVAIANAQSNGTFANAHQIALPILADTTGAVARAYGSIIDFGVYRFAKRSTFVIDGAGLIAASMVVSEPTGHAKTLLDSLRPGA